MPTPTRRASARQPRRSTLVAALALAGALLAPAAFAQDYPNKPLRIIAPFPTGTGPVLPFASSDADVGAPCLRAWP